MKSKPQNERVNLVLEDADIKAIDEEGNTKNVGWIDSDGDIELIDEAADDTDLNLNGLHEVVHEFLVRESHEDFYKTEVKLHQMPNFFRFLVNAGEIKEIGIDVVRGRFKDEVDDFLEMADDVYDSNPDEAESDRYQLAYKRLAEIAKKHGLTISMDSIYGADWYGTPEQISATIDALPCWAMHWSPKEI